jgi:hypothetical protein
MSYAGSGAALVTTTRRPRSTRSRGATMPARPLLRRDVLEPDAADALQRERLSHRHRAVDKPQLGRDQRDVDPISGQRSQRQQCFEPGDAGAGDTTRGRARPRRRAAARRSAERTSRSITASGARWPPSSIQRSVASPSVLGDTLLAMAALSHRIRAAYRADRARSSALRVAR